MDAMDDVSKPSGPQETLVQSTEAADTFADLLLRAGFKGERIVVTVYGKPRAAVIGMEDLERLRSLDAA